MTLTSHGYNFSEAINGQEGMLKIASEKPDIVILDLGLPDIDGLEVTRQLREWTSIPIIVLSARGQEKDKVEALDAGADDYLTKPFGVAELMARARVALRRTLGGAGAESQSIFKFGDIEINFLKRQVCKNGQELHLTPIEYRLLATLIKFADRVVTHNHLLREAWGSEYSTETHYLRVYMAQLRRKLEKNPAQPKYLITEPGVGYRLKVDQG